MLGAGTRSQIQARYSGMNIYYTRTSKLVSDFLSVERSLVHTLAQLGWLRTEIQENSAKVWTLKVVRRTKNPKTVLSSLWHKYSFLIVLLISQKFDFGARPV